MQRFPGCRVPDDCASSRRINHTLSSSRLRGLALGFHAAVPFGQVVVVQADKPMRRFLQIFSAVEVVRALQSANRQGAALAPCNCFVGSLAWSDGVQCPDSGRTVRTRDLAWPGGC